MNIAEIIGEYIYLKRLGEDFVGRCPFCLSHRHVMVVIASLNTYECLHCGRQGGAVDFTTRMDNITRWEYKRSLRRPAPQHKMGTVYVLSLEGSHYYIGFTQDLPRRLGQHFGCTGALWTKKYCPEKLIDAYYDVPEFVEHRVTKRYIERFGEEMVRGGWHVDARDTEQPLNGYVKPYYRKKATGGGAASSAGDIA
jgi:hypothetical protein